MVEWILMLSALLAAVTSAISAKNAHDANRTMARVDRERRVREVSLLANRVLQAAEFVDHLAPLLKKAYGDLFTYAGQVPPSNSGRYTVRPVAFLVALLDFLQQLCVRLRSGRRGSLEPRIVSAGRDSQHSTLRGNRIFGLMSLHELEPPDGIEPVSRANQAVAFAKISRSSFTCRSSRFSRLSSSRSGVVRTVTSTALVTVRPFPDRLTRFAQ